MKMHRQSVEWSFVPPNLVNRAKIVLLKGAIKQLTAVGDGEFLCTALQAVYLGIRNSSEETDATYRELLVYIQTSGHFFKNEPLEKANVALHRYVWRSLDDFALLSGWISVRSAMYPYKYPIRAVRVAWLKAMIRSIQTNTPVTNAFVSERHVYRPI
jgi:hypothetical protein